MVIEDSIVGLKAATSAGMRCMITYTDSTASEDFYGHGAEAAMPDLSGMSLQDIFKLHSPEAIGSLRNSPSPSEPAPASTPEPAEGWTPHFMTQKW